MRNPCYQTMYPVLGFAGWSGSGKTTLIERLLPALKERGLLTAVIKHDVHGLKRNSGNADGGSAVPDDSADNLGKTPETDIQTDLAHDVPGTDSWRFWKAGADAVILCGPGGPDLQEAVQRADRALMEKASELQKDEGSSGETVPPAGQCCRPGIILAEGFKYAAIPRIGIYREASGKGFTEDISVFEAIVTDGMPDSDGPAKQKAGGVPAFEPDDIHGITDFIMRRFFTDKQSKTAD